MSPRALPLLLLSLLLLSAAAPARATSVEVPRGAPVDVAADDAARWGATGSFALLLAGVGGRAEHALGENARGSVGPGGLARSSVTVRAPDEPRLDVTAGVLRVLLAEQAALVLTAGDVTTLRAAGELAPGACRAFAFSPADAPRLDARRWIVVDATGEGARWRTLTSDLEPEKAVAPELATNTTRGQGATTILQACAPDDAAASYALVVTSTPAPAPPAADVPAPGLAALLLAALVAARGRRGAR